VAIDFFALVNPKRAFAFQVSHDVGAQFVSRFRIVHVAQQRRYVIALHAAFGRDETWSTPLPVTA
jgi:hypothetical protein